MPKLATCSYTEFKPGMGLPVRTSNGHPRWKLPYHLTVAWKNLMPDRWTIKWDDEQRFGDVYRRRLESIGVDTLRGDIEHIAESTGADTIVLLCFEKLWQPGSFCHRTHFSTWWRERTGEEVPELGKATQGEPVDPPPALF